MSAREVGARLVRWLGELAGVGVRVEVLRAAPSSGRRVQVVLAVETDRGEADDVARAIRAATGARS